MSGHGCRGPLLAVALALVAVLGGAGVAVGSFTQEPGSPWRVGAQPYSVLAADFNGDRRPDFAALNGTSSNVSVWLRRATGGFVTDPGSPFGLGTGASGPSYGTVADLNHDARPDIVVPAYPTSTVSVLLRRPTGGFALDQATPHSAPAPGAAAAGDFNRDGLVDLATPDYDGGTVTIMRREVPVGFTNVATIPVGANPRHIVAADFNGDGEADLAVTNSGSGTVSILRGGPGFTFTTEGAPIAVGTTPLLLTARDLNGDRRTDLAVTNLGSHTVRPLLRTAAGFSAAAPIPVGRNPIGVATGDFNSDGRVDLAVANSGDSTVSVLLRTAAGGYVRDAGSPVATDYGASTVAVADFDADGRQDLAISNVNGNTVTILLNTTPRPGPPGPVDADRDGVALPLDCNDRDPAIRPGVHDKPEDGIDQDCSGRDARYSVLRRRIGDFWLAYRTHTRFTGLTVRPVRRGDRIRLTCRGKGCKKRKVTVRVRKNRRKLALTKHVRGARLRRGARIELRVTRPETIGRGARWTIRSPKRPKRIDRCVRPGAKRLSRCPG